MTITDEELAELERQARRDDWHLTFAGSDIRRLITALRESRAEVARLKEPLIDMVHQFAYRNSKGDLIHGGLSALEWAFATLGIETATISEKDFLALTSPPTQEDESRE